MEQMKMCPLMTIARSVAADRVVSHGACQRERCAWWDDDHEGCALKTISLELGRIQKEVSALSGAIIEAAQG